MTALLLIIVVCCECEAVQDLASNCNPGRHAW